MYAHIKTCLCICRWMRPHRATRAGTQAPPLPTSIKHFYHAIFLDFVHRQTIRQQFYDTNHMRNGRGGACVPARTSAQRRFHPQKIRLHPQMRRFHLPSPPYIIGRGGVYILRHLIIYVNHVRAHCSACYIMRQRYVFHGVMLFSRAIACVSWHDRPKLLRQRG